VIYNTILIEFPPTPEIETDPMTPGQIREFVKEFYSNKALSLTDDQKSEILRNVRDQVKGIFTEERLGASPSWHAFASSGEDDRFATIETNQDFDARVARVLTNLLLRITSPEVE